MNSAGLPAPETMTAGYGRHTFYMGLKPEATGGSGTLTKFSASNSESGQCCVKDMATATCGESVGGGEA